MGKGYGRPDDGTDVHSGGIDMRFVTKVHCEDGYPSFFFRIIICCLYVYISTTLFSTIDESASFFQYQSSAESEAVNMPSFLCIFIGRLIGGMGMGISIGLAPLYIAELAPPFIRGSLVMTNELLLVVGCLLSVIVDYFVAPNWRLMNAFPLLPGVLLLAAPCVIFESPMWLESKRRTKEAAAIRINLRLNGGSSSSSNSFDSCNRGETSERGEEANLLLNHLVEGMVAEEEIVTMKHHVLEQGAAAILSVGENDALLLDSTALSSGTTGTTAFSFCWNLQKHEVKAIGISLGLAFFNSASATTAVLNYATFILSQSGIIDPKNQIALTIVIASMKVVGAIICFFLVDRYGRRILLLVGSVLMFLSMLLICGGTSQVASGPVSLVLSLVGTSGFILSFSFSWAAVAAIVISELFTIQVRSFAVCMCVSFLFATGAVVDLTYPMLIASLGSSTYLVYAGIAFASIIFVYVLVPETKGASIDDIQKVLKRH
jgi:MFS family permease